jgi:putative membrane protein
VNWEWVGPPFGWFWMTFIIEVLFLVGLVALVVGLLRSKDNAPRVHTPSHALSVLEERYARGEIARDEFMERRSVLLGQASPPPAP